jgi:beta-glucanase (GH16 family)
MLGIVAGVVALTLSLAGDIGAQDWGSPVWSDEFDSRAGAPPDPARWTFDTGNLGVNNELEIYCATGSSTPPCEKDEPNAVQDGEGHLVIQAIRTASGTWTSARLKAQGLHEFRYGRIEASLRLPVGAGLWPAFWMLGSDITTVGWPNCGEIDFMENVPVSTAPDATATLTLVTAAGRTPPGSYTITVTAYTVSGHTSTIAIPLTVS